MFQEVVKTISLEDNSLDAITGFLLRHITGAVTDYKNGVMKLSYQHGEYIHIEESDGEITIAVSQRLIEPLREALLLREWVTR